MTGVSNYPGRFAEGITIGNLPIDIPIPGEVFWVNNSSALAKGGSGGSDGNKGTYKQPFSTIDYAIGRTTANRGDVIYVMPGHAENLTAAAGIALDVAGTSVVGLGQGALRPTITWSGTDLNATFTMSAASTKVSNILFVNSDPGNDVVAMLVLSADDTEVSYCEFRGEDEAKIYIQVADATDRFYIHHNKIYSPTANANSGISFTAASTAASGMRIEDNYIYGDFALSNIDLVFGTQVVSDLSILRNYLVNKNAGDYAIEMAGVSNVLGLIADNIVETDSSATAIDGGGATVVRNRYGLGTNDQGVTAGASFTVVKTALIFDAEDAVVGEVVNGPVIVTGMSLHVTEIAEETETSRFENVKVDVGNNLYTSDQEVEIEDNDMVVGDYITCSSGSAVAAEITADTTDPGAGLAWSLPVGANILWDSTPASTAEGTGTLVITYISLGGTIEIE